MSWMDYIAQHGWDVYLVDVRGYGRSTRPPEMDQPAANNPPIVTTDVAVKDVGSAVDFILQRRGVSKLSLLGWSWGPVIIGAYTADHNDKVDRLVLYAPVWLRTAPPPQAAPPPLGAYVAAPMATARQRLQAGAPDDRKNDLMPRAGSKHGRRPPWPAIRLVQSKSRQCCAAQRAWSRTTAITGTRASHTTTRRGSRFRRWWSSPSGMGSLPARVRKRSSTSFRVVRTSGSSRSARERISLCWKRIGCSFSRRCNSSSIGHAGTEKTA